MCSSKAKAHFTTSETCFPGNMLRFLCHDMNDDNDDHIVIFRAILLDEGYLFGVSMIIYKPNWKTIV